MLAAAVLLAQSGSRPLARQANGLPVALEAQGTPHAPYGLPVAQLRSTGAEVPTALGRHSERPHADAQSQTGPEQVLYAFQGGLDGNRPQGAVTFDSKGNLYGTTFYGGAGGCTNNGNGNGCGSIFELSPNVGGGWTETILYSFNAGNDGNGPGGLKAVRTATIPTGD
jgi:hypothetical protein